MTAREEHIQNQGLLTISSALLLVKKKQIIDDYDKKRNCRLLSFSQQFWLGLDISAIIHILYVFIGEIINTVHKTVTQCIFILPTG